MLATFRCDPKDVLLFKIKGALPQRLRDLTTALLAELHDLVYKFGLFDPMERINTINVKTPYQMSVTGSPDQSNKSMVIIGPRGMTGVGTEAVSFTMNGDHMVVWDGAVSLRNVVDFINSIDEFMSNIDGMDKVTGQRILTNQSLELKKYSVEHLFSFPYSIMPIPQGVDIDQLIATFDQPEKLAVLVDPFGQKSICLVRDEAIMIERNNVAGAYLKSLGITSLEQLDTLSWKDVISIRDRVSQIMKGQTDNQPDREEK